jgi:hypothetical protein
MRYAVAGTIRHFGLIAVAVVALGGAGAAWAQPAKACNMTAATTCTDQQVRECQTKGGSQETIGQCQFQANKACYTANNCPTSAR